MITIQHREEGLSRAYLQAVVAKAGHITYANPSFDYGGDCVVKQVALYGSQRSETPFGFHVQAKASVNWTLLNGVIKYDLEVDAYNKLVRWNSNDYVSPLLLVLLCLPRNEGEWLAVSEEELMMRKACYWLKVEGDVSGNASRVRVEIPTANCLTPEEITRILESLSAGVGI